MMTPTIEQQMLREVIRLTEEVREMNRLCYAVLVMSGEASCLSYDETKALVEKSMRGYDELREEG